MALPVRVFAIAVCLVVLPAGCGHSHRTAVLTHTTETMDIRRPFSACSLLPAATVSRAVGQRLIALGDTTCDYYQRGVACGDTPVSLSLSKRTSAGLARYRRGTRVPIGSGGYISTRIERRRLQAVTVHWVTGQYFLALRLSLGGRDSGPRRAYQETIAMRLARQAQVAFARRLDRNVPLPDYEAQVTLKNC